ncbi:MAG: hypothetical protein AAF197_06070 [Pseudomonadota bacterium]
MWHKLESHGASAPKPLIREGTYCCSYCRIRGEAKYLGDAGLATFYFWHQLQRYQNRWRRVAQVACAFCTQCLHLNTHGRDKGIVIFLPRVSQSRLMQYILAAYAVMSHDPSTLDKSLVADAYQFIAQLNEQSAKNLKKIDRPISQQRELGALVDALLYESASVHERNAIRRVARYSPVFSPSTEIILRHLSVMTWSELHKANSLQELTLQLNSKHR